MSNNSNGWIGVDLDGTLARYDGWQGVEHVGEPVPRMVHRVKEWLKQGIKVKIFTARAANSEAVPYIQKWLEAQGIGGLEITNVKDYGMIELWDDRAISIQINTGAIQGGVSNFPVR